MIELRTLGAADLRSPDGGEVRSVLQQPKRLALLVYLASGKTGRLVRRDTLLALFWPDLDQEHARAALRRALYFLRQACGANLIVGRGDDEVGADPSLIWCDANAFDDAIGSNDLEKALDLYRGDFLDGFYVQGAPEAEAWLDRERSRRRYEAALAAWQMARRALPDPVAAGRWAERAVELAPHDEDAMLAFALEAERINERAVAIRIAALGAERAGTELGRSPSAELLTTLARLRAAGATAPEPGPRDEWLVAVCPFIVRGDPSFGYLGEGMVDLLSTKLDGTGALRTADPRIAMRAAGAAAHAGADLAAGVRIAKELGAGKFVIGTILESGGRLEAGIGLYRADGRLVTRAEGRSDNEAGLFDLVDDLVRRLVADLDQSASGRLARLAALTTDSLPALKAYLHGEHEFRLGRHLQALDLFRRSTAEDPSFALGYYRLASSLAINALIGPACQASDSANRLRSRLSDHDRLLLEAQHAWLRGHTWEAERRYAALTLAFPEQIEPWYLLGDLLIHNNPYRGRSIVEAREPFERALAIDPDHVGALTQLARLAALRGDALQVVSYAERALSSSPSGDHTLALRALKAFGGHDGADRKAVIDELARGSGLSIARAFSDVALYVRDWAGAEQLAHAVLPAARSPEFAALGHIVLAHLEVALGRAPAALERLRLAGRHEPAWALEIRGFLATLPFEIVPAADRAAIEAELLAWNPSESRPSVAVPLVYHDGLHPHLRQYLLGLFAVRRGDADGIGRAVEELAELPVPSGAMTLVEPLARTLDAELRRLEGRPDEALATLERTRTEVWFQYAVGSPFFAGTYQRWLRAELLTELGREAEAIGWWRTMAQRSPYELPFAGAAAVRLARIEPPTSTPGRT